MAWRFPLFILLTLFGSSIGLRVSEQKVELSNVTVGSEFRSFGFAVGGTASITARIDPTDACSNASIWICTESETKQIYGASPSALCHVRCSFQGGFPDPKKLFTSNWTSPSRGRFHFIATNLNCTNEPANPPSTGPTSFAVVIAYTLVNVGTPSPELSIEDTRLPTVSAGLAVAATFAFVGCFAVVAAMSLRASRVVPRGRWRAVFVAERRLHFSVAFAAASLLAGIGSLLEGKYWREFAASGVAHFWAWYFGRLFLGLSHAGFLSVLHIWLGGKRPAEDGGEVWRLEVLWVSAAFTVVSLSYSFYQARVFGWSAGFLVAALFGWSANALLGMAEFRKRRQEVRHDGGAREERSSLVVGGDGGDEGGDGDDDDAVPKVAPRGSWKPWMWLAPCFTASEAIWVLFPAVLPWWLFWARFQPLVLILACPFACGLALETKIARPPLTPTTQHEEPAAIQGDAETEGEVVQH